MKKLFAKHIVLGFILIPLGLLLIYITIGPITVSGKAPLLLTPFLATFFGASFAFYLNTRKDNLKEDKDRISALRVAIFTSAQQRNILNTVWILLREWRDRPDKMINMGPISLPDSTHIRQDLAALSFMIPTDPLLLLELTLEDERFAQTVTAITRYSEFHVAEVQPALEKGSLYRKSTSVAEIEKVLGGRIWGTTTANAEQIFQHLISTRLSLEAIMPKMFNFSKSMYPDEKFLKIDFESDPEPVMSVSVPDYSPPLTSKNITQAFRPTLLVGSKSDGEPSSTPPSPV